MSTAVRIAIACVLAAGGCHQPTTNPATVPQVVPSADARPAVVAEAPNDGESRLTSTPSESTEPAPTPMPPPPPVQAVVPIELPFSADAIVINPVLAQSPVVLFDDEASVVRHRVARYLRRRGSAVISISKLERIEAAAEQGRLVLENDQICRTPLSRSEVSARYFDGFRRATINAECFEGCSLGAYVVDPADPDNPRVHVSGEIRRPHDPRSWANAKLRPHGFGMWGGVWGGLVGSSHPPAIMFSTPEPIGPWETPPSWDVLNAVESETSACAHPHPDVGFTIDMRIAVDTTGQITRCAAHSEHSMARAVDARCLCETISDVRFSAGAKGRRMRVLALDDFGFTSGPIRFERIQPGTDSWVTRLQDSPVRDICAREGLPPNDLEATVTLRLAADGTVHEVGIFGPIDTAPRIDLARCLARELRTVDLPCRPPGVDTIHVGLHVGADE